MVVRTRLCNACGCRFDLSWWSTADDETVPFGGGGALALDHDDPRCLDCPECGSSDHKGITAAGTATETGGEHGVGRIYPYRDRGLGLDPDNSRLGILVRSKAHRKQLMDKLGVVPLEGAGVSLAEEHARELEREQEESRRLDEENARMWDSPGGREYRRLADRGYGADRMAEMQRAAQSASDQARHANERRVEQHLSRITDPELRRREERRLTQRR